MAVATIAVLGGRVGTAHATDPTTGDPVVAAVGDMACAPEDSHFNGGAGQASNCGEKTTSAQMAADPTIDLLLGLGDYQYGCSDPAEWAASYTPTWGIFNTVIDPTVGNHEYDTTTNSANGAPCPDSNLQADDYFNYFGARAHPGTAGEYSFNIGEWHLISLNANCSQPNVGGCGATSPQTQWLSADLTANTQPCVLAYWHQPRWTSAATNLGAYGPWWTLLYQHHTDVVLNGHIHTYARFAFLNPSGQVDNTNGIREVIVGTGGESLQAAAANANPFPLVNYRGFGYLKMVLHPTGYDAQFITSAGAVKDSFSGTCHGSTAPPSPLTVSQSSPASVQADSSAPYVVTVHNPGSTDQTGVVLTDSPPANATAVSATPSTGTCSGASPIVCNLGTLAAGASATLTVQTTPIQPPSAVNGASATSDQASMVASSRTVTVTAAAATSYVGVTNLGFQKPTPAVAIGNTLQWDFLGPGAHSATDLKSGLGLFPDTGLVSPVAFRTQLFHWSGDYTFTDTATSNTIKFDVLPRATPATGSTSTAFTITYADVAPPSGYGEDVQVQYPGSTSWASVVSKATGTSTTFTPNKGTGKYKFRARLRSLTNSSATAFTAGATITVS
jgi:acid phosphatase type 7